MRGSAAVLLVGASVSLSACKAGYGEDFESAYFVMRDAQVCAGLDPRTDDIELRHEVTRTANLIQSAIRSGHGDEVRSAEKAWQESDAVSDKICPFQASVDINDTIPSIEIYRAANDSLEAAIAAEAN